jgi:6-phosphofructokinase 2
LALFPAGGHNGNMLCSLLNEEGISFHKIETNIETRENWVVLETTSNKQFRFTFPGRAVPEETIHTLVDQIRSFSPSLVVASGSLPPGLPEYFYGLIVKNASAVGARCVVDTSGEALQALRGKHAFLIKPNLGELQAMLNVPFIGKGEIPFAAQQAVRDRFAEVVVVSMGGDGAWLVTENEKYYAVAPPVVKKSTVGAGDSMVAGIIFMLQQQKTMKEVLAFGVACGTAATMNEGTRLFDKDDVLKLYQIIIKHQTS